MNRQAVHLNAHEVTPVGLWSLRASAPTVATVVSLNFPGLTPHTRDLMRRFTRTALQGLVNTGARPILVDSSARQLPDPAVTATADAVLVLGGGDVDPALYGVGGSVPNAYGVDRRADLYTMDLLGRSLDRDVPLLAIGRGSHLLNVACGGTLVSDLGTGHGHRGEPGDPMCPEQEVALEPGSMCVFQHDDLGRLIQQHPSVGLRMLQTVSRRLDQTEQRLAAAVSVDVPARLADYLLSLPARHTDGAVEVTLPLAKKDIASLLDTTPESLSLLLSYPDSALMFAGLKTVVVDEIPDTGVDGVPSDETGPRSGRTDR